MEHMTDKNRPTLAELTTEQPESTDRDYLAWVEEQIAEAREEVKDPANRIPAVKIWEKFGLDH